MWVSAGSGSYLRTSAQKASDSSVIFGMSAQAGSTHRRNVHVLMTGRGRMYYVKTIYASGVSNLLSH